MKIVLVSPEVYPFAKTGGLADVCGALPQALAALGHEVSVIMPDYRGVGPAAQDYDERLRTTVLKGCVRVFFVRHRAYFDRPGLYGERHGDYPDNLERFVFFCRAVMDILHAQETPPDIIHAHDWQTGALPLFLQQAREVDPFFADTRLVYTIHNLAYQGIFPRDQYAKFGLSDVFFNPRQVEFHGQVNMMKTGIVFADRVTTVSPQYAREVVTRECGCGLEGVLQEREDGIAGILNGLDYTDWNPAADPHVVPGYSAADRGVRAVHKERLQRRLGLPVIAEAPLIGFVGRLCYQKGLDLVALAARELALRPVQMVFLGVGDAKYQDMLRRLAREFPRRFAVTARVDESMARGIYAGADIFLMPSIYEPCGLAQMIALRYGAVPIVAPVGGLLDTVVDGSDRGRGNGFVMPEYSVSGLMGTVDRAVGVFAERERFAAMAVCGMQARFSWEQSARRYVDIYQEIRRRVPAGREG